MRPVEVAMAAADRPAHRIPSVAIVGPGLVGTTTAYALLVSGAAVEIVLIGRDRNRVEGQVKDLRDAALYSHATRIAHGSAGLETRACKEIRCAVSRLIQIHQSRRSR